MGSPVKKEAFEQVHTWLSPTGSAGPSGMLWVQSRGGNRDYRRENLADQSDPTERIV
jgi:hypothetical protein